MAKRSINTSTDIGGESKKVEKPGTFHVSVRQGSDQLSTNGKSINGCSAILTVLDGTDATQKDKEYHLHLFDPDLSKSEKSVEWANKKQTAYAIAINELAPAQMGGEVAIDFDAATGQQFVINLDWNENTEGEKNIDLSYANIYHVDDPRVKDVPKNTEALALIPADKRQTNVAYFDAITSKVRKPANAGQPAMSASDIDAL